VLSYNGHRGITLTRPSSWLSGNDQSVRWFNAGGQDAAIVKIHAVGAMQGSNKKVLEQSFNYVYFSTQWPVDNPKGFAKIFEVSYGPYSVSFRPMARGLYSRNTRRQLPGYPHFSSAWWPGPLVWWGRRLKECRCARASIHKMFTCLPPPRNGATSSC